MKTTNIVSTPNIKGNIGSCSVQSNDIKIGDSVWTSEHLVTQVNSCTGEIINSNQYTDYTGVSFIIGISIILAVVIFLIGISVFTTNSHSY